MIFKKYIKPIIWAFFIATTLFSSCNEEEKKQVENTTITDSIPIPKISKKDSLLSVDKIEIINPTFLGNEKRNYYGNEAPSKLKLIWRIKLGTGTTRVGSTEKKWSGAGWTGQPLMIKQDTNLYIIQGTFAHYLKKINAKNGKLIWKYKFDDVLKGTGTFWVNPNADSIATRYIIMQGSRKGNDKNLSSKVVPSFRAVSFITGKVLWQLNSTRTRCYSRDVDGSALVVNDTAYIGLENALFTVFNPDPAKAKKKDGIIQPEIIFQDTLYDKKDIIKHRGNLVTESSPSKLKNRIYVTSGSGHVYGYNLNTKKLDWEFFTGSDMDGSPIVTHDSCILVSLEKEYISGKGGVFKLDPSKPADSSVVWYFPVKDHLFVFWHGGIIGSVSINDYYLAKQDSFQLSTGKYFPTENIPHIAAFVAIDENLYVINTDKTDKGLKVKGPNKKHKYKKPKLLFKYKTGPSISTPIIVGNKIIAATYKGLYLFEHDDKMKFKLLAHYTNIGSMESTPFVYNKRIYIASRDGFLYCFGQ